jgi:hypothetical protein
MMFVSGLALFFLGMFLGVIFRCHPDNLDCPNWRLYAHRSPDRAQRQLMRGLCWADYAEGYSWLVCLIGAVLMAISAVIATARFALSVGLA